MAAEGALHPLPRDPMDVGATFDSIAEAFDGTRSRPWPFVEGWLGSLGRGGGIMADVGCGNGRHLEVACRLGWRGVGLDGSPRLLALARRRLPRDAHLLVGDARRLPLASGAAGAVLFVAVLHHIAGAEERAAALSEVRRVLAPGGPALVSVWALDDPVVARNARARTVEDGDGRDLLVPWRAGGGPPVDRYHRAIGLEELAALVGAAGLGVERAWDDGANHVVASLAP